MKEQATAYTPSTGCIKTNKATIYERVAGKIREIVTLPPPKAPKKEPKKEHIKGGLILTRRVGETIMVGELGEIKIRVMELQPGLVRFQIDAPRDVPVHREEIFKRIQEEKKGES